MSARPRLWRLAIIGGAVCLPGCTQPIATVTNAAQVRSAAVLTIRALERSCPIEVAP